MTLLTNSSNRLALGDGHVVLDERTGAPVQFVASGDPGRRYLLDDSVPWHSIEHQWGSGFIITDDGAGRWNSPASIDWGADGPDSRFAPLAGVNLEVRRRGGNTLTERFTWTNTSSEPVRITSLGIQTPFADIYEDSASALARAVHAHVFTGGSWSWALAQPMSGDGIALGLIVRGGALNGYSIESRNQNTSSNARGHILLHVTDHARNPAAFGGQPVIVLQPGDSHVLEWELGWFNTEAEFLRATDAPADIQTPVVATTSAITITTEHAVHVPSSAVDVTRTPTGYELTASVPGVYSVRIGADAHTEVAFHTPLIDTVRARAQYILRHQRSGERPGLLAHALVPVDTDTLLTQTGNGWSDWSDGSERIGMAIMLQLGRRLGWLGAEVDEVLTNWAEFARHHLLDADYTPRRGSNDHTGPRLYDTPWLTRFFIERYRWTRNVSDLTHAVRILERAFELGVGTYLAIGLPEACADVADALDALGDAPAAAQMRQNIVHSAEHFLARGADIPAHEVSYEQSMVAPLVSLFNEAYRLTQRDEFRAALVDDVPKLLAFSGAQPYARLHRVAIRHWDGYWFGTRRQWGDVFPHHWSALTAAAINELPADLRSAEVDATMHAILRGGMSNFFADGSATCAFVLPTAVDGVAAHSPDPLANDQDWHLVIWMQLYDRKGVAIA